MSTSELLNIMFSGVVAFSTLVYAILTWRLTSETRIMRKSHSDPKVSVCIYIDDWYLRFNYIKIINEGMGPAYNITFSIVADEDKCHKSIIESICKLKFLNSKIDYLPSGGEIKSFLYDSAEIDFKDDNMLRIDVNYQNALQEKFFNSYTIDFGIFEGISRLGKPETLRIADALEKIDKGIEKITSPGCQLNIIRYTPEHISKEREKRLEGNRKYVIHDNEK